MDAVVEAIQHGIHGEPVGSGPKTVQCDLIADHGPNRLIDPSEPVQYEVIRVVDVPMIETAVSPPETWILDLLRCPDCEQSSLGEPTEGYDEALVELTLVDSGGGYTVDATDLRVLEYSPATDGVRSPPVTKPTLMTARQQDDAGLCRVSRLQNVVDNLRQMGKHDLADQISRLLDFARDFSASRESTPHE